MKQGDGGEENGEGKVKVRMGRGQGKGVDKEGRIKGERGKGRIIRSKGRNGVKSRERGIALKGSINNVIIRRNRGRGKRREWEKGNRGGNRRVETREWEQTTSWLCPVLTTSYLCRNGLPIIIIYNKGLHCIVQAQTPAILDVSLNFPSHIKFSLSTVKPL